MKNTMDIKSCVQQSNFNCWLINKLTSRNISNNKNQHFDSTVLLKRFNRFPKKNSKTNFIWNVILSNEEDFQVKSWFRASWVPINQSINFSYLLANKKKTNKNLKFFFQVFRFLTSLELIESNYLVVYSFFILFFGL